MDMCGKNQEKILRLQFQKRLNNKKVIREISDLLENFVWFNNTLSSLSAVCYFHVTAIVWSGKFGLFEFSN